MACKRSPVRLRYSPQEGGPQSPPFLLDEFHPTEYVGKGARGDTPILRPCGQAQKPQVLSDTLMERDNYIGSRDQPKTPKKDRPSFFIHHRLEPALKLAHIRRRAEAGMAFRSERLFHRSDKLFPQEPPALMHGDLWTGEVSFR